jgi:hypothetical protein
MAASAGATDWMPASSLWSFSAFSFSKAAIYLSIPAQFGLTALMSRMAMGVAQPARIPTPKSSSVPAGIIPLHVIARLDRAIQ